MALLSTIYRFQIDVSDVDQGVYEAIDIRIAMHPSESVPYLLTRLIAYISNIKYPATFSPGGLSDADGPALRCLDDTGNLKLWIEIGNPAEKKLHRASKMSPKVLVYTYKNPGSILKDLASGNIHKSERVEVYALAPSFLDDLGKHLKRNNNWNYVHQDGSISVGIDSVQVAGEMNRVSH